jgi:hypothetical protein
MNDRFQNFMNARILFVRNRHLASAMIFVRDMFNPHVAKNAQAMLVKNLLDNQK